MQAFDSVFHAYCLIGERRLVIDRWTVWYLGWVVHRNCSQMLRSIDQKFAGGSIAHFQAFVYRSPTGVCVDQTPS